MYPRKVDAEVDPKPDPGVLAREQGQGIYNSEGGSNFLSAERYAAATGHSNTGASAEQLFGPRVHEKTHEEILSATSGAGKSGSGVIHSQDERQSTFATEGSSNYLCAKRDEESRRSEGGGGGGGIGGGVAGYGEGQGFSGSK